MNETDYLSKQSPASNFYKPHYEVQSKAKRTTRADMNRDKSIKEVCAPVKRNDSPSPTSYKDVDKNWKQMSNFPTTNFNYSIAKSPKKSFIDQNLAAKKKVP